MLQLFACFWHCYMSFTRKASNITDYCFYNMAISNRLKICLVIEVLSAELIIFISIHSYWESIY